jgi:hypothetical protein
MQERKDVLLVGKAVRKAFHGCVKLV